MKKRLTIILAITIGFSLGWWSNGINRSTEDTIKNTNKPEADSKNLVVTISESDVDQEDFNTFFYRFMIEPNFQLSRVDFPLELVSYKDGYAGGEIDTTYHTKDKWQHNSYYLNQISIPIIYDNYEMQLRDTDERVFVWAGVENGINVKSYFKRIEGKWYLIKEEDFST